MVKEIIARGQATITIQQDPYTITQSVSNYIFSTTTNGIIANAVSFISTLRVSAGNSDISNFAIGSIIKPDGFSAITVNNTNKTITYSVAANTTTLADNGHINIPIIIKGVTYNNSFNWSKSKAGQSGPDGEDGYTIKSSRQGYSISTDKDGRIHTAVSTSTVISALRGKLPVTPAIGTLPSVSGCTLAKSGTKVTIVFTTGTLLAENGTIDIPVSVDGLSFQVSFTYAKAKTGANGTAGTDTNLLDWVENWNNNKTTIGSNSVITPKLFAGVKNSNGTLTGTAIGRYTLSTINASGSIVPETIDGIYGFKDGYKTFTIDNTGSIVLGKGNQFIRYNSATGRIEFGSDVSLNWVSAINTAKKEAIDTAASTAQKKADAAKNAAISTAATDAANKVNAIKIGNCNYIRNSNFSSALTGVTADGTSVSIDTANLYNNYRTLKISQNAPCTDNNANAQRTYFTSINSRVCKPASFSMYVKGSVAGTMKIRIGGTGIHTKSITTGWQRITLENIIPTSAVVLFGFQTAGTYWCALPMLVESTKVVDWTPAPEDITGNIADAKKAGTDAKTVADAITSKANSEGWSNKLTYIGSTGIFTGTLSANTVNAIRINASQITAGTINAARIDVAALKTSLITAGNIEALTLNVVRGRIGGWSIDSDSVYRGTKNNTSGAYTFTSGSVTLGSTGIRGFKWRLDATGAGAVAGGNISWDASGNVTFGASVVLNWTTPINNINNALGGTSFPKLTKISATGIYTGTLTAAQVNAVAINATSITTGTLSADRIATGSITSAKLNANSIKANIINVSYINGLTCTFVRGTIAGWTIAASQISKNNIVLGADGSIYNGTKWRFANDGSGQIASGNISWNATGTVTFGTSVSLQWKNDIEAAKSANYGYRYKKTIVINGESDKYYPVVIKGGDQTIKRKLLIRRSYSELAPSDWADSATHMGGLIVHIRTNFGGWGGISYSWDIYELSEIYCRMFAGAVHCGNYCMFAFFLRGGGSTGARYHIYSDQSLESDLYSPPPIPRSPQIAYNQELIFQSGSSLAYAPAPRTLTATVENEIRKRRFIVLAQGSDTTLTEHPLTYISSTGIYTGTLTANQVNAVAINASRISTGILSADRIAAGSINSTKLNADSIKSNIINTTYINGLTCTFARGTIGGWTITAFQISKNNISLGTDGTISNGTKWRLGNDGAGRLANGNIIWDTSGNVTFGSSVSLNWMNAANNALNSAKSYADTKKTEAINTAASDATSKANAAKELASAMAFGKMLYRDPEFRNGNNSANIYNNSGNGTVTITRKTLSSAPNDSKNVLEIRTTGSASPGNGGFSFATITSNRKVFITRIIAKIPAGRNIDFATNSIGTGGSRKWLTSNAGTGDWQEYIYKVICGTSNFSSTHFFYITGTQGTSTTPVVWHVAYVTVFDTTTSERYTTTIDSSGIYTGTIRANQVLIDNALIVGGSSYNGSISVRDAGNNVMATLNRSGITAVAGQIGGWHLNTGSIYASSPAGGHRVFLTSSGYLYNDDGSRDYWGLRADGSATFGYGKILFDNDGSGYVADQNIKWDTKGNVTVKGNITANSGKIAGFTVNGNKLVNTAADSSIEFSSLLGNASLIINSSSALLSLRADSARTGIYLQTYATGAKGIYIIANAGSLYSIEAYGPMQLGQRGGERWCVPGVLYIGCKYNSGNSPSFRKIWGEGCNLTSCSYLGSGQYRFYHNLRHTNYTVIAQVSQSYGHYGSFRLLERTNSYFTIQNLGSSGSPDTAPFDFVIYGRNTW